MEQLCWTPKISFIMVTSLSTADSAPLSVDAPVGKAVHSDELTFNADTTVEQV